MKKSRPAIKLYLTHILYTLIWVLLFPFALGYLFLRGRKDREYREHLAERFGSYQDLGMSSSVWIHAVSMGETIAVAPLVRALLAQGERVIITHFTPAGRRTSQSLFAEDMATGRLKAVYVPFEFDWVFSRFFKTFAPKYGLIVEADIWPRMISASRRRRVPLFLCNGLFSSRSVELDRKLFGIRSGVMRELSGMMVKSSLHKDRFHAVGIKNIAVTGELRFDQPVPKHHLAAANELKASAGFANRKVIALTSAVAEEEDLHFSYMKHMLERVEDTETKPLFIYVPREPERFSGLTQSLNSYGLRACARSDWLDADLSEKENLTLDDIEVIVGNSLGEMFFYLALSDMVVVGRSFHPRGSHNVIEPLLLGKPVVVGPYTWNIEYPSVEAIEAGVLTQCETIEELETFTLDFLADRWDALKFTNATRDFLQTHAGATEKCIAALPILLNNVAPEGTS